MRIVRIIAAFLVSFSVQAQEAKLVAVLPLNVVDAKLTNAARVKLEESIRTVAGDVLAPQGYLVLTGDNTIKVLRENGVDEAKMCDAMCTLDMGKELKARYLISGAIASDEGTHSAFVRIYDVTTGGMLATIKLKGKTGNELEDAFDERGKELFEKAGLLRGGSRAVEAPTVDSAGPVVRKGKVSAVLGDLTVDARPRERVRLELTDPTGRTMTSGSPYKNALAVVGTWTVKASASGYATQTREVVMSADDVKLESIELQLFG